MSDSKSTHTALTTFIAIATASTAFVYFRRQRRNNGNNNHRDDEHPTVAELNVYPIKSCGPMNVQSAKVTDIGFAYDRFAQVSDSDGNYLTPRDKANAKLFHVTPVIVHDDRSSNSNVAHLDLTCAAGSSKSNKSFRIKNLNDTIEKSATKEVTPMIGPKVKVQDLGDDVAAWLSDVTDIKDCRLTAIGPQYHRLVEVNPDQGDAVEDDKNNENEDKKTSAAPPVVSLADEAPFLLTTTSSLKDLNSRLQARGKSQVGMQRFRPNIVVQGTLPWEEDTWKRIRIGGMEFHVWQRCGRCAMTTIDRTTLERGPEPLATLSTFREREKGQRNFGMHMIPVKSKSNNNASMEYTETSLVEVGHKLEVLEYDEQRLKEWKRLFSSSE